MSEWSWSECRCVCVFLLSCVLCCVVCARSLNLHCFLFGVFSSSCMLLFILQLICSFLFLQQNVSFGRFNCTWTNSTVTVHVWLIDTLYVLSGVSSAYSINVGAYRITSVPSVQCIIDSLMWLGSFFPEFVRSFFVHGSFLGCCLHQFVCALVCMRAWGIRLSVSQSTGVPEVMSSKASLVTQLLFNPAEEEKKRINTDDQINFKSIYSFFQKGK